MDWLPQLLAWLDGKKSYLSALGILFGLLVVATCLKAGLLSQSDAVALAMAICGVFGSAFGAAMRAAITKSATKTLTITNAGNGLEISTAQEPPKPEVKKP